MQGTWLSIYHMSDDFKIRSLQFQFFNLEWGSVQTAKAFESAWHLCIYEKRSSILLIFHIDNVVQQVKLQGRRNSVGGQRGAIVPLDFYKWIEPISTMDGGHILPHHITTLLPLNFQAFLRPCSKANVELHAARALLFSACHS